MTEICQRPKCLSKKWPKCFSERKAQSGGTTRVQVDCLYRRGSVKWGTQIKVCVMSSVWKHEYSLSKHYILPCHSSAKLFVANWKGMKKFWTRSCVGWTGGMETYKTLSTRRQLNPTSPFEIYTTITLVSTWFWTTKYKWMPRMLLIVSRCWGSTPRREIDISGYMKELTRESLRYRHLLQKHNAKSQARKNDKRNLLLLSYLKSLVTDFIPSVNKDPSGTSFKDRPFG